MVSLNSIILTTVTVFGVFNNYTYAVYYDNIGIEIAKWDHAVNSKGLLNNASKSDSTMIEADVTLGNLNNKHNNQFAESVTRPIVPIMGHPPVNKSDLSLEEFLSACKNLDKTTVKLDFKSTEAFEMSRDILKDSLNDENTNIKFWLNADILPGPGVKGQPAVNADSFIKTSAELYPNAILSLGWTTTNCTGNKYTQKNIDDMLNVLRKNNYISKPVTYAVKASLAANSKEELISLLNSSPDGSSLTIWCNDESEVLNYESLVDFVKAEKPLYWDLPQKILNNFVENIETQLMSN